VSGVGAILLIFLAAAAASAQAISGVVTDRTNAAIENAEVSLVDRAKTLAQTKTDADGRFSIDLQNAGAARIVVRASPNLRESCPKISTTI
jgi:hypothetical protein